MPRNKSWFNIEGKASDNPTVYIYGPIGAYGIEAKDFVQGLSALKAKEITIRMHSPGGNVFEGMSVFNAIEEHPAKIKGQVDGMCGSICSVVAMACDTLTMAKGSMMMIHNASGPINGNAVEIRKMAEVLDQVDGIQANAYMKKTGMKMDEVLALMGAETFMNAEKAKQLGFCDAIGNQMAIRAEVDFACLGAVPDEIKAFFNEKDAEPATEREIEQILRDAGVSNTKAKAAVAAIKGNLRDEENPLADAMTKAAAETRLIAALTR